MELVERLHLHLQEAEVHIERLRDVLHRLRDLYPFNSVSIRNLRSEDLDKLDVLAFRFAKLQDLLGAKIFREFLLLLQFPAEGKDFLSLLRELDKEGIVDLDRWRELRGVRNDISHDYPHEVEERIEAINYPVENVDYLGHIVQRIKERLENIEARD